MNTAAVAAMRAWFAAGHRIVAFWRGLTPTQGPVRRDRRLSRVLPRWSITALAREHGFPIRDVPRLSSWPHAEREARASGADVLVSVYFPFLIPKDLLDVFAARAVNFHPAPLPRYRGPSPVQAMVLDRSILTDGAMTLHVLTPQLDEGPIVARQAVPFPEDLSLGRYALALAQAAGRLAGDSLPRYLAGDLGVVPQNAAEATYVKVTHTDMELTSQLSADEIRWRCQIFGRNRPLRIAGLDRLQVRGFAGVLGPPTSMPPAIGPFSVGFDAADARIRLWRKLPLVRQMQRGRAFLMLARTPIA